MPTRVLSKTMMRVRRVRYWAAQFHWWAILALIAGICCVVLAFTDSGLVHVVAVGVLSVTLAVLATREEPT